MATGQSFPELLVPPCGQGVASPEPGWGGPASEGDQGPGQWPGKEVGASRPLEGREGARGWGGVSVGSVLLPERRGLREEGVGPPPPGDPHGYHIAGPGMQAVLCGVDPRKHLPKFRVLLK